MGAKWSQCWWGWLWGKGCASKNENRHIYLYQFPSNQKQRKSTIHLFWRVFTKIVQSSLHIFKKQNNKIWFEELSHKFVLHFMKICQKHPIKNIMMIWFYGLYTGVINLPERDKRQALFGSTSLIPNITEKLINI